MEKRPEVDPVYVIESIPGTGDHQISPEEIARESIPTPGHLRLYPELGRGAMGRIHPATDRNLLRHVALKRLDKRLAREAFYRDGFVAEAQITGQLEHPNIVPVHELAISDNGPGIPQDVASDLFEPFVTTKPTGSGTGLGLAVCWTIVERAGGSIAALEAPSGGARFVVRLPRADR